ncbi:hypothetical protein PISMIDRAFT_685017, partial [Pisolithus microcarpus 441]
CIERPGSHSGCLKSFPTGYRQLPARSEDMHSAWLDKGDMRLNLIYGTLS